MTERVERHGLVIKLVNDKIEDYDELHADVWPGVLAQIDRSKIRNYSIFQRELTPGEHYLFAYFEYVGEDFEADMAAMRADSETQRWWVETDPCQEPIDCAEEGEHWSRMTEVFHHPGPSDEAR